MVKKECLKKISGLVSVTIDECWLELRLDFKTGTAIIKELDFNIATPFEG